MRPLPSMVSMLLVCGLAQPAISGGTIDIQTTPFDNFVVVDITIVDNGGGGGCDGYFFLKRWANTECNIVDIATIARQPGTTSTHRFVDAPLQPSRAYVYQVVACSGFTCGWGEDVNFAVAATTPAPALLGHGHIESSFGFAACPDALCPPGMVHGLIVDLPPDGWQYVGTGTEVLLYGDIVTNCQNGWLLDVSQVVPSPCTVSVEACTWSWAKSLFR